MFVATFGKYMHYFEPWTFFNCIAYKVAHLHMCICLYFINIEHASETNLSVTIHLGIKIVQEDTFYDESNSFGRRCTLIRINTGSLG